MDAFAKILRTYKHAIETGDTEAFLSLFTADAVYEDSVYGTFTGHDEIKRMFRDIIHQDASGFRWELVDAACEDNIGYANYRFSLKSSRPGASAERAVQTGCARFTFDEGLISSFKEWSSVAGTLTQLGVPDNVVLRFLKREAKKLREDPDYAGHLSDENET